MLSPDSLRSVLSPVFDPQTMPAGDVASAVDRWGQAYVSYASQAVAGGALPVGPPLFQAAGGDFLSALDASLRAMWTAVPWAGPGLVGVTAAVPPLQGFLLPLVPVLVGSPDPTLGLTLVTAALHTYTQAITVTLTPPSGTPFIVTLL